ncbi:MAG: hypothetical protein ABJB69_10740 [Spartobacteria bacterium]
MKRILSVVAIFLVVGGTAPAQTRGTEFQLTKITKNLITTPQFTYTGAQQYQPNQRAAEAKRRGRPLGPANSLRAVVGCLSFSSRFKPIAKTGIRALSEWPNIETGSVADVAAEFLSKVKHPISDQKLFELILQRRPVKRRSIPALFHQDGRFQRVAPNSWSLKQPGSMLNSSGSLEPQKAKIVAKRVKGAS